MYRIEDIEMVGAVLIVMGALGYSWHLLMILKRSVIKMLIGDRKARNKETKGSPGVGSEKNRWRGAGAGMHYGENIVELQGLPTTHVEEDFNREAYELPREQPATDYIQHVIDLDMRPRIQNLETNATLADTRRWEMARQIEGLVKNEGSLITLLEKMASNMLARDKRIAEMEDRLKDATFILYGGKPLVDDG